jgi:hypothetical protein
LSEGLDNNEQFVMEDRECSQVPVGKDDEEAPVQSSSEPELPERRILIGFINDLSAVFRS